MTITRHLTTRRALLACAAIGLVASITPAGAERRNKKSSKKAAPAAAPEPTFTGMPLPIPRLVDLADGETFDLVAEAATHAFVDGKPVDVVGYGGTYMGPALRLKPGTKPKIRLVNRLARPTNVHWHGLLVPSRQDGATLPGLRTDESWETELTVDQPAATLWYHAHVHGRTARDVHDGLAGLLIVDDGTSAALGLPSTWGVDDIPLVLQDRDLDDAGRPVYGAGAAVVEHGFRGSDMVVNGVTQAIAEVPARLVRLRLLNAANARTFRIAFEDQRTFRLIATDAGFLPAPIELTLLALAPGERAEILVDFAEETGVLLTGPDLHEHRTGADAALLPDVIDKPVRLVAFDTVRDAATPARVPATLSTPLPPIGTTGDLKRRRFELRAVPNPAAAADDHGRHMMPGSMSHGTVGRDGHAPTAAVPPLLLTINGRSFAEGRIDEKVALGATEIWEIASPDMAHPFHLHGARFRVLSEDGDQPKAWNRGLKDTIRVENSAELLVTFTRPADAKAPFFFHCHLLEHEDGGMMGAFTVG
ncbi:multicopper oxidase domain-containing protein [Pinisolibacter sp.]|uniref:multicopper oxidase domain-containing protein n=1 Tax=Pinisolibacter sp. TaxID=2172024 RepID=UPI002FDCB63F